MSVPWSVHRLSACRIAAAVAGMVAALGTATACGAANGDPTSDPNGYSSLMAGGSVSPVPTSSPKVVCIRAITGALRSVVDEQVPPRRATTELAASYGADSAQVQVFWDQLAAFRDTARGRGADVAATSVWPALEAACA